MGIVKTKTVYACDVCGKQSEWTDDWLHRIVFKGGRSLTGYEKYITVCSEKCAEVYDMKTKKVKK